MSPCVCLPFARAGLLVRPSCVQRMAAAASACIGVALASRVRAGGCACCGALLPLAGGVMRADACCHFTSATCCNFERAPAHSAARSCCTCRCAGLMLYMRGLDVFLRALILARSWVHAFLGMHMRCAAARAGRALLACQPAAGPAHNVRSDRACAGGMCGWPDGCRARTGGMPRAHTFQALQSTPAARRLL